MRVRYGKGKTKYGPGVEITLSGDEVATAIGAYLVAHGKHISGARAFSAVPGDGGAPGMSVYVDPSGFVISEGMKWSGRGLEHDGDQQGDKK